MVAQKNEKQRGWSLTSWWLFLLGFVVFLLLGFWITPIVLYAENPQPFQFSHKLHLEDIESCDFCHFFREDGSYSGIPGLDKCKDCHNEEDPIGETVEEKVFVEKYLANDKPVPWRVYSEQPPCVFFSHAAHVKNAGFECSECHGDHGKTDNLRVYQYNRLTGYSRDIWGWNLIPLGNPPDRMKMDDCVKCHRDSGVRDACFVCHK